MRRPRLNTREIVPRGAGGLLVLLVVPTVIAVVALAILLGRQLEDKLRQDALDSAERSGQVFASLMFDADEFEDGRLKGPDTFGDLRQAIRANNTVMAVRLYSTPDRVIYATDRALKGEAEAVDEVTRAFAGETTSEVTTLGQEQGRSEDATPARGAEVLEVNLPIQAPGRRRPALVAAVFLPYGDTNDAIASQIARTRLLIAGVALLLVAIVVPLFIRGARSMAGGRRHTSLPARDARGAETRRAGAALPAQGRPAHRRGRRAPRPGALAAPRARAAGAGQVHPAGRGDRPDRAADHARVRARGGPGGTVASRGHATCRPWP